MGFIFECHYDTATLGDANIFFCHADVIASESETTITDVTGALPDGKTREDVKAIFMPNYTIADVFPKGIEKFFPNVIIIDFLDGGLTKITAEDLEPFENLEGFALAGHSIISLDENLFQHNKKLIWIDLSKNKIEHVGKDIFKGLTSLADIDMTDNSCLSANATTPEDIKILESDLLVKCPPIEKK